MTTQTTQTTQVPQPTQQPRPTRTVPSGPPLLGATGRWRVSTESSTYLLDLDAGVATRSPAGAAVPAMRRDHEPVRLHSVALAEVGAPLALVLDGGGNGALTLRRSTPVREIVRLTAAQEVRVAKGSGASCWSTEAASVPRWC
jgi:hypothetical protein